MRRYAGRTMIAGKLMAACVAASGLWSGGALAQPRPGFPVLGPTVNVPTITCDTPPQIFNTGIAGNVNDNASFATASKISPRNGTKYDLHWQMTRTADRPLADVSTLQWTDKAMPVYWYSSAWAASQFSNAEWLGFEYTFANDQDPNAVHYNNQFIFYKYTFNLDPVVDESSFQVKLLVRADDYFQEVYVNNKP